MSPQKVFSEWWGDTVKRRLSLATASLVALITLMHFGEVAKPYWFVMQYQFDAAFKQAEDTNTQQFLALQIATKEASRDSTQAQVDRLEYELQKNPDSPSSVRQILTEQIRRYTDQLRILNLELDDLRRRQTGRRP
jgi:hypothetical protein